MDVDTWDEEWPLVGRYPGCSVSENRGLNSLGDAYMSSSEDGERGGGSSSYCDVLTVPAARSDVFLLTLAALCLLIGELQSPSEPFVPLSSGTGIEMEGAFVPILDAVPGRPPGDSRDEGRGEGGKPLCAEYRD